MQLNNCYLPNTYQSPSHARQIMFFWGWVEEGIEQVTVLCVFSTFGELELACKHTSHHAFVMIVAIGIYKTIACDCVQVYYYTYQCSMYGTLHIVLSSERQCPFEVVGWVQNYHCCCSGDHSYSFDTMYHHLWSFNTYNITFSRCQLSV